MLTKKENQKVSSAILMATSAHAGQFDQRDRMYIMHSMEAMSHFGKSEEMIVAVLHDVLEDTDVTEYEIRYKFGDFVADAVVAITHNKGETNLDYWKRCASNLLAYRVKVVDLFLNQETIYEIEDEETRERLRRKYTLAENTMNEYRSFVEYQNEEFK